MVSLIFIRWIVIYPVENTIHSLHNRGKMVLITIVVAHPDWSCNLTQSLCAKGSAFEAEIVLLFVSLLVFATTQEEWPFSFQLQLVFFTHYGYKKNTCFKEKKKNNTGEQKLRYFKIDMNDVQLRIWSHAQKLKVLR